LGGDPKREVFVIAVWEPILPTDMTRPSAAVLSRLSDTRVQQYWDPERLVALDMAKSIARHPDSPKPNCCVRDGYLWDLVAIYPPGVEWNETLPMATYIDGPVVDVKDSIKEALPKR
jgi:hypothetical protein